MFSHTFILVAVTSFTHFYLSALITPHWKVLWSQNLRHSAPIEVPFPTESFPTKVKICIFRPKTMDYSPWFDFSESEKDLKERYHQTGHLKRSRMVQISAS